MHFPVNKTGGVGVGGIMASPHGALVAALHSALLALLSVEKLLSLTLSTNHV